MKYNTTIDFNKFCRLVKKYVYKKVNINEIHKEYIAWKKARRVYLYSATEWIITWFQERTLDDHGNCLKRNKHL